MRAVQLSAFGDPSSAPAFTTIAEPAAPGAHEVAIDVLLAPVNHNDLLLIAGRLPFKPALPAVLGNEAVGRISAVGAGVNHVRIGDLVTPPLYSGTWRERMVIPAADLFALPAGADLEQLAMLRINPLTAGLMLSEYVKLQPGDWVVQNAANSGVGRAVIALAKSRGLHTINLVRRPELIPELQAAGGDIVLLDNAAARADNAARAAAIVGERKVRLAIDGVLGEATARLVDYLAPGSSLIAYAMMSGEQTAPVDLMPLMFKSISSHFFYQNRPQYKKAILPLLNEAAELVASGKLYAPVAARYALSEIDAAIKHTMGGGKVLIDIGIHTA
ncbi:MAG: zinc-dependent alcohol dehydrogenase family protein [Massilia sp.]